jgi:Mg/Co/Ni transporter MgtE
MRPNAPLGSAHLDDLISQYVRRDYVPLRVDLTVGEALESLRSLELGEKIVYFYVVDGSGRLEGIVPTRRLLMSAPGVKVAELMSPSVVSLETRATVRDASDLFLRPVVLALAESVSIQSVTLTLQSLRGPDNALIPKGRSISKEFVTALLLGLACGAAVGGAASAWQGTWMLGLMIGGAITLSMITASLVGLVLPATLHWLRRDPTIAAGPIVLALADLATLLFYFNIARLMLAA